MAKALSLLVAAALLAGCGGPEPVATIRGGNADGMHGAVLAQRYDVPDIALRDTAGEEYSLASSTEKPLTLVFFGYTHCPDICPMVMANLASALTRLTDDQRARVEVVMVTTDPARDDAATLRDYLDRFDPGFVGLTGDLRDITRLGAALGVFIERGAELPGGGYEVDHGTPVVAIDAKDRTPIVWTQGTSAAQLAEDVARILDDPTVLDEALDQAQEKEAG